jgi:hypothetical protein
MTPTMMVTMSDQQSLFCRRSPGRNSSFAFFHLASHRLDVEPAHLGAEAGHDPLDLLRQQVVG